MTQMDDPRGSPYQRQLEWVAITMMSVGLLYIVMGVLGIIMGFGHFGLAAATGAGGAAVSTGRIVISGIFAILLGSLIGFGGIQMRRMQGYGVAMAGSIAALLPCTCCCVVGLPIGVWSIFLLSRPEIRAAFNRTSPPPAPPAPPVPPAAS